MANTPSTNPNRSPPNLLQLENIALQWNIQGLRCRLPELKLLISRYNPISIALQETMLPESLLNPNLLKDYTLYIKENHVNPTKTGLGLAVKTDTPHRRIDLSPSSPAIAIEIDFPIKITIVSIYISLSSPANSRLKTHLNSFLQKITSPVLSSPVGRF